ncbi:MAG TPA: FAD-binding protein [Steroidobacteraceae bacterium]|jgi:3-oxo-5alpha-steroid 4-dehydrogenase
MSNVERPEHFVDRTPLVLGPENTKEYRSADLLIVGAGAAGLCTAIEARQNGADVLVVDRFEGGGSSAYSGGVVYAGGTAVQRSAGMEDSVDEMYKYLLREWGATLSPHTIRAYCEQMVGNVDWLVELGVPFGTNIYTEKTAYPPDDYQLYYCGNEKMTGYREFAKPAARGHRTAGKGFTGKVLFAHLYTAATRAGVRFINHAPVGRLVVNETGDVTGVEVNRIPEAHWSEHLGLYKRVAPLKPFNGAAAEEAIAKCRELERRVGTAEIMRARHGVVLATGGFEYNLGMLRRYQPFYAENFKALLRLGSMGADGSGIELGQSVGGKLVFMDKSFVGRTIAPPNALLGGLIVNKEGARVINEESYTSFLGEAIGKQPSGIAWLLVDGQTFWKAVRQSMSGGLGQFKTVGVAALIMLLGGTRRARTVNDLAKKCGLNSAELIRTIDDHNNVAERRGKDPMGKSAANLRVLGRPIYAINVSTSNKFTLAPLFTTGGLMTDDHARVVRPDGSVVKGLYAVGRAAAGMCATNYISGTSLGDCVFSGRRAGRHAAALGAPAPYR